MMVLVRAMTGSFVTVTRWETGGRGKGGGTGDEEDEEDEVDEAMMRGPARGDLDVTE